MRTYVLPGLERITIIIFHLIPQHENSFLHNGKRGLRLFSPRIQKLNVHKNIRFVSTEIQIPAHQSTYLPNKQQNMHAHTQTLTNFPSFHD